MLSDDEALRLLEEQATDHPTPMTAEQATEVYTAWNDWMRQQPARVQYLDSLMYVLNRETAKGLRCSVCGRYGDGRCTLEC